MKIGQIVFIDKTFCGPVQTGIITKRERDPDVQYFWYEVLCNDGQNYVIPGWLLSPAGYEKGTKSNNKKLAKTMHACTNKIPSQLNYIYNQQQHTNT